MSDFTAINATHDDVIGALRAVVAEKGADYVYVNRNGEVASDSVQCYYVHGDQPGCIAGAAFHKLGVPLEVLAEFELQDAGYVAKQVLQFVSYDTQGALTVAQQTQDGGGTWGQALRDAESVRV